MANPPSPMTEHGTPLFPLTRRALAALRRESLFGLETIGRAVQNTGAILGFLGRGQFSLRHFNQQAAFVGIDTMGIALIMTTFSGMVIALQIATEMVKQGAGNYVGALVALAIIRELGPVMTGFAVIAMAGSAFAAELSTMQITSQVSALQVLHVSPLRYLLMPRVLACMVMVPLMTLVTTFSGILGGLWISNWLADIHPDTYLESVWYQTQVKDVAIMMFKASVFGYLIAILSATIGLNTHGGSREVGLATTRAVVWAFVAMAVTDYLMTFLFYGSK